jgi:hypothetical protein
MVVLYMYYFFSQVTLQNIKSETILFLQFLVLLTADMLSTANKAATTLRIVRTVPRLSQACLPTSGIMRPAIAIPSFCVPAAQHIPTVHHQSVRWYASKKAKGGKGAQKKAGKEEAEPERSSPKDEVMELKFDEQQVVKKMNQVSEWLKKDLSGIRIGRANPGKKKNCQSTNL